VIFCPFGTSGRYLATGSSRRSLPSSTSCRTTVPIQVLVTLPMRIWSLTCTGSVPRNESPGTSEWGSGVSWLERGNQPVVAVSAAQPGTVLPCCVRTVAS
jgi:hypothetical protein